MAWKFDDNRPVYVQIIDEVKQRVLTSYYEPGDKLPSVRELALEASVNPNTMQRALSELEKEKIIYAERTSGRYVTDDLEFINTMKSDFAGEITRDFITKLKNLGFIGDEILAIVKLYTKEGEE